MTSSGAAVAPTAQSDPWSVSLFFSCRKEKMAKVSVSDKERVVMSAGVLKNECALDLICLCRGRMRKCVQELVTKDIDEKIICDVVTNTYRTDVAVQNDWFNDHAFDETLMTALAQQTAEKFAEELGLDGSQVHLNPRVLFNAMVTSLTEEEVSWLCKPTFCVCTDKVFFENCFREALLLILTPQLSGAVQLKKLAQIQEEAAIQLQPEIQPHDSVSQIGDAPAGSQIALGSHVNPGSHVAPSFQNIATFQQAVPQQPDPNTKQIHITKGQPPYPQTQGYFPRSCVSASSVGSELVEPWIG